MRFRAFFLFISNKYLWLSLYPSQYFQLVTLLDTYINFSIFLYLYLETDCGSNSVLSLMLFRDIQAELRHKTFNSELIFTTLFPCMWFEKRTRYIPQLLSRLPLPFLHNKEKGMINIISVLIITSSVLLLLLLSMNYYYNLRFIYKYSYTGQDFVTGCF